MVISPYKKLITEIAQSLSALPLWDPQTSGIDHNAPSLSAIEEMLEGGL